MHTHVYVCNEPPRHTSESSRQAQHNRRVAVPPPSYPKRLKNKDLNVSPPTPAPVPLPESLNDDTAPRQGCGGRNRRGWCGCWTCNRTPFGADFSAADASRAYTECYLQQYGRSRARRCTFHGLFAISTMNGISRWPSGRRDRAPDTDKRKIRYSYIVTIVFQERDVQTWGGGGCSANTTIREQENEPTAGRTSSIN